MLGSDARFQSIYTEHVDAKSLVQLRQPASDLFAGNSSDTKRILADISSALEFLHGSRIVHNDLKLANILYSPTRGAVLIDFGLSFLDGHPSPTGGSPWYLPPEFMRDWRSRGPPCDVWALGVVSLWLLGHIPLPEKSPNWLIVDLHPSKPGTPSHLRATDLMSRWLKQIENARSKLCQNEKSLAFIVKDILAPEMKERMDAATLSRQITQTCTKREHTDKLAST